MMFNKKNIILCIMILFVVSVFAGCTQSQEVDDAKEAVNQDSKYPMEIIDGTGTTSTLDKKPERIVSLAPSHTEILYGLELGDKVVGVTNYCDYPAEVKDKPKIGDSFTLNIEKLVEIQPDLAIAYWPISDEVKSQLEAAGITVVTYSPESLEEVVDTIGNIGTITDTEDKANELVTDINNKKTEIIDLVKNAPKPKVFYEIEYSSALWTAGAGSFIHELITLSGGVNVAEDAQGPYAQYSVERLIEHDPEIYVTNTFNIEIANSGDIKTRSGFENIEAIKNDRIEILDGNLLSRPSQRVTEALELMAKAIHPELFK